MKRGVRRGRDRMVVGFTTTCAISAYHHLSCEFEPRSLRGVLDTTLCDKVCQLLATGQWFSPVFFTNKTDRHDITDIVESVVKHHKPNLHIIRESFSLLFEKSCYLSTISTLMKYRLSACMTSMFSAQLRIISPTCTITFHRK